MQDSIMEAWWDSSQYAGGNAAYVEALYESYLEDPQSVSEMWRAAFDKLPKVNGVELEAKHSEIRDDFKKMAKTTRYVVSWLCGMCHYRRRAPWVQSGS